MSWRRGLVVAAVWAGAATALAQTPNATRGRALFDGEAMVPARISGQDFVLPAAASRCVNCHDPVRTGAASSALATQRVGPALTQSALTEPTRRRGGPPSRYDAASLCTLLRTGVDPAYVIILRTMPRYEITESDCQSLWLHLTALPTR